MNKSALARLILFVLLYSCFISLSGTAASRAKSTTNLLVICNGKMRIVLDCAGKASVIAMYINNRAIVNAPDGMYTSVNVGDQNYTSLHLLSKPSITRAKDRIVINNVTYGGLQLTVSETWTFLKTNDRVVWRITRKYSNKIPLTASSSPVINFASIKTWDGAFQGYGGLAWFYLFTEKPSSYGVHSQTSHFWNSNNADGLDVEVSSPGNNIAMTYKRTVEDKLSFTVTASPGAITPLMDKDTHRRLFIRGDGNMWAPIPAQSKTHISVTFAYADTQTRYNRGHLAGVNGGQVSAVLNTIARIGVIDSLHYGGNSWATPYGPICLHEQYIAQLGLGINDPSYFKGYKACLDFYRDHAIKEDGRVYSRWAYTNEDAAAGQYNEYGFYEAQWGTLMDSNPDYVSNVADLFNLTGDRKWVGGQQQACEKALDWILKRDTNNNNLVEMMNDNQDEHKSSDWIDIVWASYENAFVNAKLYYALVEWANVEQVLGNETKAKYYAGFAAKLRETFNKPTSQGGFWDEQNKCYVHWRDNKGAIHGRNMVTPVNFMAIAYGICDQKDRERQILDAIEKQMQQEKLFFWPLTMTSYEAGELRKDQRPFPNYENGDLFLSWGSLGVAAYAKYQPQIALKYVKNVLERYGKDGLAFQRYSRKDQSGQGDDILAGNSLAIVGLYQSIYGINPLYNRLFLNPHLTPELSGTTIRYHYHDQLIKVNLNTGDYTVSDGRIELNAKKKFGFSSTSNLLKYYNEEDEQPALQVSGSDHFKLAVASWTGQYKTFQVTYQNQKARAITYRVMQLKPLVTYKLLIDAKASRIKSNSKGEIVFTEKALTGNSQISITAL